MTEAAVRRYAKEINFFFNKPTRKHIEAMIEVGFKNWDNQVTYIYRVDLTKLTLEPNYVFVTSTEQQHQYTELYWEEFWEQAGDKYSDNFQEGREEFIRLMREYLKTHYRIKDMSIKELVNHKFLSDWLDFEKHFDRNLRLGNKNQYASYIPHVQMSVEKPIRYEDYEFITLT